MCNTAKHHLRLDLNEDGTIALWHGEGIITLRNPKALTELIIKLQQAKDLTEIHPRGTKSRPSSLSTETVEEYLARGKTINKRRSRTQAKPKSIDQIELTLEGLGLIQTKIGNGN
ncbi:MAG: hypothetical protein KAJ19_26935 [Gammaproteobacteria bacterium]|nr:hypothetical protein [Gammaproteobacteria bacterium]